MNPHATPGSGATTPQPAALRDTVAPGYAGEWALFCDYTTATGQPTLPTTVDALTGFFTALPARPATLARRVRAIAAAHRRAGHLLSRPDDGPAALAPPPTPQQRWAEASSLIAACPTRGWPHGLHGRRDAFLIVAIVGLDLPHRAARALQPDAVTVADSCSENAEDQISVAGQDVPTDPDPRACPACAVVRWLDTLGILDGLGRGSARMDLTAAHTPTHDSNHQHHPSAPHRWRHAATLLPAIDQHGWHDDYRPMTTRTIRTIRTRLARARDQARQATSASTASDAVSSSDSDSPQPPATTTTTAHEPNGGPPSPPDLGWEGRRP
ncbi:hypothetical protein [Pseudonocardia parietis]|uniref:Uncharacterized protein n=1 Tax=Pseudonocardia parietis TaxID=570936 RepID=A0ABS4W691_9PSEU|nr:hypothetical protein [Pseudonocardia parietis]MBP2371728.1 hypothetical protein [Pseudonocardia parietis]